MDLAFSADYKLRREDSGASRKELIVDVVAKLYKSSFTDFKIPI